MVEVHLSSSIICERYRSLCQLGCTAVAFCSIAKKHEDLATELNANAQGQHRSEYVKGMALHWEGITSSTARWLTDGTSYQLFGNRHQQKRKIALAFRVEKQVKPSLHRHTRLAVLLLYQNGTCSSTGPLPGPHPDVLQHGPTGPCLFLLSWKGTAVDRAAAVALETHTKEWR